MGTSSKAGERFGADAQIDQWLQGGGLVITASERARRALAEGYHRARRLEMLSGWPAPAILDWQTFLRTQWEERRSGSKDALLLLSSAQEKKIWAGIAGSEQRLATLLSGPRNRVAALAMQAHQLLCSYAPRYLRASARTDWNLDAGVFSEWLTAFDEQCSAEHLLSPARLPLELIAKLEEETSQTPRPPILLAGFDRILPVQKHLLDARGTWSIATTGKAATDSGLYSAADTQSELAACALWCRQKLEADPGAKLLVISQDVAQQRGAIERAFLAFASTADSPRPFEFSLGVPLSEVIHTRGAFLLLRWMTSLVAENELDWLFSSGLATADEREATALRSHMRLLRRRGLERPEWSLQSFLNQPVNQALPSSWTNRLLEAQRRVVEQARSRKSPLEWAEFVPALLNTIGWPGGHPLSSEEFQVVRRWELALEICASLGFDGRRISWTEFLQTLVESLDEILFAPESRDAPIQIAGPAESAGLTADGIWFLGVSEDAWPAAGATHPLLPLHVQRDAAMPHATAQLDWELSQAIITRLLASAPEVRFSYARQGDDSETRPSRMDVQAAGQPQRLPPELLAPAAVEPVTVNCEDCSQVAFPGGSIAGGASVLTHQSQCPFKAFAAARLGAQGWNAAEPCLTAAQRGQLLHAVLHSIWGGEETGGIQTLSELKSLEDRRAFVATHVQSAIQSGLNRLVRERLPKRYLELEERRLNSLIGEWLEYELARVEFCVLKTEDERNVQLNGLSFDLRLDRIDQLNDGTLLVIDYKTGLMKTKVWETPRPEDVQLPLYASFAPGKDEKLGGLAFARVRRGDDLGFAGYINDARANLDPSLRGASSLVKNKLDEQMIADWKREIEALAQGFLAGNADVDPREYPKTCKTCELQALCRIQEHRVSVADDEAVSEEETADE